MNALRPACGRHLFGNCRGRLRHGTRQRYRLEVHAAARANVARVGRAGLAILDPGLRPLVATPGLPPLTAGLRGFLAGRVGAGEAALRGVQDETPAGLVVGIRPAAEALAGLVKQPGATAASAEALLLEADGAAVRYLSPLADGTPPLARTLALDTPGLAAAFAVQNPGGFGAFRDYRDVPVLVASRVVPGIGWTLAYKIDRAEALGETDRRLARLLAILLALALTAAGLVAAWRHGASRRAAEAAARYREIAGRFEQQARFIRTLTDAQPGALFVVDAGGRLSFANAHLARQVEAGAPEDLAGKTLAAVFGPAAADRYGRAVREAFATAGSLARVDRVADFQRPHFTAQAWPRERLS